jgi:TetR/AcrR family transcriptional regulator
VTRLGGGETVRDRLLRSAIALFARKGYAATTVREIVEAAGVTKPVLYYHFGNKEGIYLAIMESAFAELEKLVAKNLAEPGTSSERLLRVFDSIFVTMMENLEVVRVMDSIYYGPPQGAPFFDFEATHSLFDDAILTLVAEGVKSGEFRRGNVEDMKWALIGAMSIVKDLNLCHPELGMGREGLARVIRVVLDGVVARGEGEKESKR